MQAHVEIAAELNVGAAAGHVGGDGDGARHAGLGDDIGFLFVEAGVEHGEILRRLAGTGRGVELVQRAGRAEIDHLVALALQKIGKLLGFLDRGRADQHGLGFGVGGLDFGDDGGELFGAGAIDLVVGVDADDRHVGRNFDHVELVDFGEFVGLGRGRAGHAGEFLVEAEIILEGDRGQGDVFRLDLSRLPWLRAPDAGLPNSGGPASCGR